MALLCGGPPEAGGTPGLWLDVAVRMGATSSHTRARMPPPLLPGQLQRRHSSRAAACSMLSHLRHCMVSRYDTDWSQAVPAVKRQVPDAAALQPLASASG